MDKKIVIYTRPDCIFCTRIKDWMNDNNMIYSELDVTEITDSKIKKEIIGVPHTIITNSRGEEEIVKGFNSVALKRVLL
ncbi:glutaredoxin family protein [Paenibacillus piscarius]|uniref:glutaredoxin family protein n=1 Tax=Paenibacillus piscarius TaxID=1089681 RepID=UPI001EE8492F|nr:glutaredoxin domain-containing protein [Paenibacillus piscarius]